MPSLIHIKIRLNILESYDLIGLIVSMKALKIRCSDEVNHSEGLILIKPYNSIELTHRHLYTAPRKVTSLIDCTEERNCLLKCTLLFNILSRQFFFFPHWSFKLFRISKLLCKWLKACSERSQRSGDAISNKPFEGINSHIGRRLQYWYHLIKIPFLQGFWYKVKANVDIKQETKRVLIVCSGRVLNLWFLHRNVFSRSAGDKPNPPPRTTTV